ncbi:glycoside hydrolase family 32 protein [Treponema sp. Marseille-Q3903]|uniref:glycoside hydrolase family 32 protein n=1 Tax=Treponema sp. Marseille-Q3903 TaxID=2766703 RepID=UPI0016523238|nr:glycoside hydrolase family 32 protein [Treponema sp. Marseille-Q3903]MBC6712477.1 glycoside hydrolase family 32 protein [Treponema sp. Marseille-Q3903]
MMEQTILEKARKYEAECPILIRPVFHLTPKIGWMNDPNGFTFYNGEYHLFYQYHPYSTVWGPMHWGHAVSKDLLKWEYIPVALAPDTPADAKGCFSGCAVPMEDGKLALVYTGVSQNESQVQCLAVGDGKDFIKSENNPIIDKKLLPEGATVKDFRDPKIIKTEDGYIAFIANLNEDKLGQILTFKSKDLTSWTFDKVFAKNQKEGKKSVGIMWECPDFFKLDDKYVLMLSAQGVTQNARLHSGNIGVYATGNFDKNGNFVYDTFYDVDCGTDFYAQQTVLSPDGRRIMIGWLQNWDTCGYRTENSQWYGQMSVPREITIKNNKLIQQPVKELLSMRCNEVQVKSQIINNEEKQFTGISGNNCDMEIYIQKSDDSLSDFEIHFFQNDEKTEYVSLSYSYKKQQLILDRSFSGTKSACLHQRSIKYGFKGEVLKIRAVLDSNSLELFFGEGELAMSMAVYQNHTNKNITFMSYGMSEVSICKWDIK